LTVDAVVVPGGTINADTIRTDEDAQAIVREAYETGKVPAVFCHGPATPARAIAGETLR
jgi:protease I